MYNTKIEKTNFNWKHSGLFLNNYLAYLRIIPEIRNCSCFPLLLDLISGGQKVEFQKIETFFQKIGSPVYNTIETFCNFYQKIERLNFWKRWKIWLSDHFPI